MSVSGHSPYDLGGNQMAQKHWDQVQDLPYSDPVKAYIAANLELEDAMTYLIDALEKAGIADDTVIVISADHFPYGLDDDAALGQTPYLDELYGYTVTNYLERDHNRLIIWMDPITVDTPVSSLDILPTLSNLFGTAYDSRLFPGRDVFSEVMPLVFTMNYDWKTDLGTYLSASDTFLPNDPDQEISAEYIEQVKTIVRNKIRYCEAALDHDYFRHVFSGISD